MARTCMLPGCHIPNLAEHHHHHLLNLNQGAFISLVACQCSTDDGYPAYMVEIDVDDESHIIRGEE